MSARNTLSKKKKPMQYWRVISALSYGCNCDSEVSVSKVWIIRCFHIHGLRELFLLLFARSFVQFLYICLSIGWFVWLLPVIFCGRSNSIDYQEKLIESTIFLCASLLISIWNRVRGSCCSVLSCSHFVLCAETKRVSVRVKTDIYKIRFELGGCAKKVLGNYVQLHVQFSYWWIRSAHARYPCLNSWNLKKSDFTRVTLWNVASE